MGEELFWLRSITYLGIILFYFTAFIPFIHNNSLPTWHYFIFLAVDFIADMTLVIFCPGNKTWLNKQTLNFLGLALALVVPFIVMTAIEGNEYVLGRYNLRGLYYGDEVGGFILLNMIPAGLLSLYITQKQRILWEQGDSK